MAKLKPEQLAEIMNILNRDFPSAEDVAAFAKELTAFIKRTKQQLDEQMAQNKGEMSREVQAALKQLEGVDAKLAVLRAEMRSDTRTTMRYFDERVNGMASLIPDVDAAIQAFKATIPPPTEPLRYDEQLAVLQSAIDALRAELEELKKVPRGTGGGVTNARIAQSFKYILHTEEPVGAIDGVNTEYTVSQPIFAVMGIVLNGEHIAEIPNYTINGRKIVFTSPFPAAYSGKDFEIKYI